MKHKFRGLTEAGEWVHGSLVECHDKTYICEGMTGDMVPDDVTGWHAVCLYQVLPSTVGKWTGLLDKHHREVYQGDYFIVNGIRYEVRWKQEAACYYLWCDERYREFSSCGQSGDGETVQIDNGEIFGNIHL